MKTCSPDLFLCLVGGFDVGFGIGLALCHASEGDMGKLVFGLAAIGLGIVFFMIGMHGLRKSEDAEEKRR